MKKALILIFFLCAGFSGLKAQHEGLDSVVISRETFNGANASFDTDFKLWARPGWGSPPNYSYPWSYVEEAGAFTTKNGTWITGSDSSIRIFISTYGGIDETTEPWPDASNDRVVFGAPPFRYSGSWDTLIWTGIDVDGFMDMALAFGIVKRSNAAPPPDPPVDSTISGFGITTRINGGDWNTLADTASYAGIRKPGKWTYAIVNLPASDTGEVLDICFKNGVINQNILADITLTGWADLDLVEDFNITGAGGANTITTDKGTLQMSAEALPAEATNKEFTWSVVNGTGIATISETGLLSAECNGTVYATATANDYGAYSEQYEVTLSNQTYLVVSVSVTSDGNTITQAGGTKQMTANVVPACANDISVTWSLSPEGVATIDANGLLTAVSDGSVVVTATANDGSGKSGSKTILISTGGSITDISNAGIILSPNPVTDVLNLENTTLVQKVEIVGLNGSVIKTIRNDARTRLSIDASNLNGGIYFIKLQTNDGQLYMSKFIKQ
ncbi:MAG: Ig-like domain-containing protein [Bacteroidales bacterium]|nr:Ig-like domain-containing protein [Bacteroidales bacterium]